MAKDKVTIDKAPTTPELNRQDGGLERAGENPDQPDNHEPGDHTEAVIEGENKEG